MKAETFLLALVLIIFGVWLHVSFQSHQPPIPPCGDFHNCRIVGVSTDGDSAIYDAVLLDTCRHSNLVHFKAESGRFNVSDTAQGNFFGQLNK